MVRMLKRREVEAQTGERHTSLYRKIKEGLFVRPVKLGVRASGWPSDEVEIIVAARVAGFSDDKVREVVSSLHERRKTAAADALKLLATRKAA